MTEEKKTITREKHPGRVAEGHKLAAPMKKRKEERLSNKEQSTVQSTEQSSVQSTVQSSVQSTEQTSVQSTLQSTEQPSVHSNGAYIHGVGILFVLAIGVSLFFTYDTFQPKNKKLVNEKKNQPPKRLHML